MGLGGGGGGMRKVKLLCNVYFNNTVTCLRRMEIAH